MSPNDPEEHISTRFNVSKEDTKRSQKVFSIREREREKSKPLVFFFTVKRNQRVAIPAVFFVLLVCIKCYL